MTAYRGITSCFPHRLTQLVQALLPSDQRVSWQPFAYCFLIPTKINKSSCLILPHRAITFTQLA
jgi:hypothetical protein